TGSYDSYECENSADALHRAYQAQGYYEAQVTWKREEISTANLVRITFLLDEGPELKIRGVDFTGVTAFSADDLRAQIQSRPFPKIGVIGLGEGGYLTSKQLEQDEAKLVEFYRKQGYPTAKVKGEVSTAQVALSAPGAEAAALALAGPRKDG